MRRQVQAKTGLLSFTLSGHDESSENKPVAVIFCLWGTIIPRLGMTILLLGIIFPRSKMVIPSSGIAVPHLGIMQLLLGIMKLHSGIATPRLGTIIPFREQLFRSANRFSALGITFPLGITGLCLCYNLAVERP